MRRTLFVSAWLMAFVVGGWVIAQEDLPSRGNEVATPDSETKQQYSYAIGLDIGSTFHADGVPLDTESLLAGLLDGLKKTEPKFDQNTCEQAIQKLGRFRMQAHIARNREYLEKNRQTEGVVVLPSGLQYKVLTEGSGASPSSGDWVTAHYRGQLIDGTVFDSSYERNDPLVTRVNQVIPGWTEALQLMKVGDRWQLVIPSELAYGENGAGGVIPPHSTLVFEMELLSFE